MQTLLHILLKTSTLFCLPLRKSALCTVYGNIGDLAKSIGVLLSKRELLATSPTDVERTRTFGHGSNAGHLKYCTITISFAYTAIQV